MSNPLHGQGDEDAEEHTEEDLEAGVAEQFGEFVGGEVVFLEEFLDDLVEQARLLARRAPHALRVEHHDDGEGEGDGEDRGGESGIEGDGGRERAYGG